MKKPVVLLAVLTLSVSCSKVEKVEKNMDKMMQKTQQMSSTTEEMKETHTIMYQQIRSKEAEDTRNKKFEILNSKDEDFGSKISAADVYFKSFEFQLWTAQKGFDDQHTRDVLLLDAANEFTMRICDIYNKLNLKKMSPTNDGKKHSAEMSFYALAATMHLNHHYQEELIDDKAGLKAISFYDIVKSALLKDSNGMAMTEYEEVLVSGLNKEIMTELVKARVDILSALALKNLTDKRNMTLGQKLKAGLYKLTNGKLGSIELPEMFSKSNDATNKQTIKYLDGATKTKIFLADIGTEKKLEKTLKSAYSKIKLGEEQPQSEDEKELNVNRTEIRTLIDGLLL
jgi:hypothetical protein